MTLVRHRERRFLGDVLSTGEVSTICKVALSTIGHWFDSGLIRGYKTPGGHRRIFRADLYRFLQEHNIPIHDRLDDPARVLVVAREPQTLARVEEAFGAMDGAVTWTQAAGSFQAGLLLETMEPDIIVIDAGIPALDGAELCKLLKVDPQTWEIDVVILADQVTREAVKKLRADGAAEVLGKPVKPAQLQRVVTSLLS